jgi:hypothetical protein
MKTYRTIEEYRFGVENTFINLEWRQIVVTSEDGCFIYKREWDRTLETLGKLLENMEWARGIIRAMLQSPIPSEIQEAKGFISKIRYYKEFASFGFGFLTFFSEWQRFYSVLQGKQKIMAKPMKMKILPDTKKVIAVDGVISPERKKKIWDIFTDKEFLTGDIGAFNLLCDGDAPKGKLGWQKTYKGYFYGVSLIHFLKRLGIDFGDKKKNIRAAACFFQRNDGKQLTGEMCSPYLQNYERAKTRSEIIKEINLLFSKVDETAPI